jgi:hypothetical protein
MVRTHVSKNPIARVRATKDVGEGMKPQGFWYEVDGDWRRWCGAEQPDWLEGRLLYAVDLGKTNVLKITTVEELDAFHAEYAGGGRLYDCDWRRLAKKYDAIEIAPYRYERRLDPNTMWYYPWDCASGVIWRPKGVKLRLLPQKADEGVDSTEAEVLSFSHEKRGGALG